MNQTQEKQQHWMDLLDEFQNCDISIKDFCVKHDVKYHQFKYWRTKLECDMSHSNIGEDVSLNSFVKITPIQYPKNSSIKIETNGILLHIVENYDPSLLKSIITTVKEID